MAGRHDRPQSERCVVYRSTDQLQDNVTGQKNPRGMFAVLEPMLRAGTTSISRNLYSRESGKKITLRDGDGLADPSTLHTVDFQLTN